MDDLAHMLFGASLVAIGVLAAALSDRIRGIRLTREVAAPRVGASGPIATIPEGLPRTSSSAKQERARTPRFSPKAREGDGAAEEVVFALVAAGYKKPIAIEAASGCSPAERTTIEDWTRAALYRCARGRS